MIPIRYSIGSLTVRKGTSLAVAFGMALVVFVLSAAMMLVDGVQRILVTSGRSDNAIVLRPGASEQDSTFEMTSLNPILTEPGVKLEDGKPLGIGEAVSYAELERVGVPRSRAPGAPIPFRMTTEDGVKFRPELHVVEGRLPKTGTDEIMFGRALKGRITGLEIGGTIEVRKKQLHVVGMFEAAGSSYESEIWGDRASLSPLFSLDGTLSVVRVRLTSPSALDTFRGAVESNKALGLSVERETDYYEKQSEGLATMYGVLGGAIAILAAIGAMIGATITMYGAVATRQREVGTLRALGFSAPNIIFSFLIESMILTAAGGALGALASMVMTLVKFSTINMSNNTEVILTFHPSPQTVAIAIGVAALVGLFGGLMPAIRAARISAVEAMRG